MSSMMKKPRRALAVAGLMAGVLAIGWGGLAAADAHTTLTVGSNAPALAILGAGGTLTPIQQVGAEKTRLASAPLETRSANERGVPLLACSSLRCASNKQS